MTIGESIRYHRKKLNLTQAQLAERIGVTAQAVSKWENETGLPDISMAVPLAWALGTTTDELLRFGERYQDFKILWEQALRAPVDSEQMQLEVAEAALREFPYDRSFRFRAAWSGKIIAESSREPNVREEYYSKAAAHAQLLMEMDPEDRMSSRRLHAEIFGKLKELWAQQEDRK